nr:hypothetical protein Iba_chr02eCG5150 [Ipomoea batatas]
MSLEDYYEGSRRMQQEIYATLQSSNPPFMPTDLGLPPPLHSWVDRHLNEGPDAPVLGSGVASGAHPPGLAFPSDSGGRREIPFDSAYLNSAANLQVLADLSNVEVSLGPLDSVDGAGPQDVRGDVSSQAPGGTFLRAVGWGFVESAVLPRCYRYMVDYRCEVLWWGIRSYSRRVYLMYRSCSQGRDNPRILNLHISRYNVRSVTRSV